MSHGLPAPLLVDANGLTPHIDPTARVAPTAVVAGHVHLGERANVWYGAVLRAEFDSIRVGAESNVQDGVVIHVDPGFPVEIGERVTVGHRAVLHGCTVGDRALIGIGATVTSGSRIPAECMVAAGSVVLASMEAEPGWLIAGTPARPKRPLTQAEIDHNVQGSQTYLSCADQHDLPAPGAVRPDPEQLSKS